MKFHEFIKEPEGWETLERVSKFENPYLQVSVDHVRTPSRPDGCEWTVAHRKGAVGIAAVTHEKKLLLVRQERVPIRATIWELPAGQIDENADHNDTVLRATALRELREETGYELAANGELKPLGYFFPSPGFTDEHSHLFLAEPVVVSERGQAFDANEAIVGCRAFSFAELREMIANGEIRDANTLATFARLCALGLI